MKDKIFGVLQRIGRSFMLPIAILPVAGLLLGIGSSFTNETTIAAYGLQRILGEGTVLHALLVIMNEVGSAVFDNLPLIFAVGVAIGMSKKEKEVAALSAVIAYLVMNTAINGMLLLNGEILEDGRLASDVLSGTITSSCGILTLQTGVFGGIIVGLGVAALHNRFYQIQLPTALSFFGGTRFVPIISTLVYMLVGILMYFVWPVVQNGIYALGSLVTGSGYFGTLIFGLIKRALIPFGLHHVFYMPFWQTAVGGTMEVAGQLVEGGQNIFFAQLANAADVTHFSADATRYFSGEFIFMIFGLPGAALAMYHCAKPEKKKQAGSLLLSASLASMLTGITEPIEFSFLFTAPLLFAVQVILAGSAYMVAHICNIAVGLTFSGGLLDFFLFGVLQGNDKTSWMRVIPIGVIYFLLYYVIFRVLIVKLDLKTPGREDDGETKLYRKADVEAKKKKIKVGSHGKKGAAAGRSDRSDTDRGLQEDSNGAAGADRNAGREETNRQFRNADDERSAAILRGLGGRNNIEDIDCCATRLRCTVADAQLVDEGVLKSTGAAGVIRRGNGVQVVYGPQVAVIKSKLEDYLEGRPTVKIGSPLTGKVYALADVPDDVFAQGMMGYGAAVEPTEPLVAAPEDGEVVFVFDTGHAVGFLTDSGVNLLIHVGIDTVKLDGQGFEVVAKQGERVKKGAPLIRLDLNFLRTHAPSLISPIVCTEISDEKNVRLLKTGDVKMGTALLEVALE